MRLRVLGSAAGGGFPQWNCACPTCAAVRSGAPGLEPRTQDSIAVSADGDAWLLLNASPDVHAQIAACPALAPRTSRDTPIRAIVLTNGDLDHCLGLFSLRESQPLVIYATASVRRGLVERNLIMRTLSRFAGHTTWRPLVAGVEVELGGGLFVTPFPVAGKLPLHLEGVEAPSPEDNLALRLRDARGACAVYAPSVASLDGLAAICQGADAVLLDGTFWSSDELIRLGLGTRRAEEMAHLPVAETLRGLDGRRLARTHCLFTHVNNTNPMLLPDSPEANAVAAAGWELARDGLELEL